MDSRAWQSRVWTSRDRLSRFRVYPARPEGLRDDSGGLFQAIEWAWTKAEPREIDVLNETAELYRFFDATLFAEYLYDKVADTIRTDLKEELGFLSRFDRTFEAVRSVVDMPDRRASLMVRLLLQNAGKLSQAKRGLFAELSDEEVDAMERATEAALSAP